MYPLQPQIIILRMCIDFCKLEKEYQNVKSYIGGEEYVPNKSIFGSKEIVRLCLWSSEAGCTHCKGCKRQFIGVGKKVFLYHQ